MKTSKVNRVIAVLKIPVSISKCIGYAKSIVMAMTDNPNFPAPSPSLEDQPYEIWILKKMNLHLNTIY